MKILPKLFPLMLMFILPVSSSYAASSPEPTARQAQTEQYALMVASGKLLSLSKWKVEVDFGQALEIGIKNKDLLRDDNGNTLSFNSPMDALNFMNSQGWTLVSATTTDNRFTAVIKRPIHKTSDTQ
ncbi:hypothetical protein [Vibrio hangzhouensis]|uniref:Uncharacterized protein n=1 Tax=Vibrio hangzhouensis TaxID=462991 RepID=A0A1H5ZK75_9VIBR|nr:hypothetical protein [Vibrio hangzhouensis]SEG36394.1 hypothetical protein SAMN04488244_1122 [Vibrio hangzhouensis]